MTKEQFEPINIAFGEMNAALDSCMMSPAAGYRVVLAYEKVKASLQPYLKIDPERTKEEIDEDLRRHDATMKRINDAMEAGLRAPGAPDMPT